MLRKLGLARVNSDKRHNPKSSDSSKMKSPQKTTFLRRILTVTSEELASKNGGSAYFFKFEDQEEVILVLCLRFKLLRLRIIEGLFSMVIPNNMIALHTIHFAGEEDETIWSTASCISKQHGSRDTRDQTQTTKSVVRRSWRVH